MTAHWRVCEKTGDCPKRRARARRFINDLREARWTVPRFFHRPSRSRLRFVRREGVRKQETEPGTLVTGQILVTAMA